MKNLPPIKLTDEQYKALRVQISNFEKDYVYNQDGTLNVNETIKKININPLTIFTELEQKWINYLEKERINTLITLNVDKEKSFSENREIIKTKEKLSMDWKNIKSNYEKAELEWRSKLKPLEDELANLYLRRKIELNTLKNEVKSAKQELSDFNLKLKLERGY